MTLTLHSLKPPKGSKKRKTRVGRGDGSGKGTTAGRGTKGQRARAGGRGGLKLKGLKQMVLGFPKSRGFKSTKPVAYDIRIGRVVEAFDEKERVTVAALKKKGLLPKVAIYVKFIGGGDVTKPLKIEGIRASASVQEAVEKAGGSFVKSS